MKGGKRDGAGRKNSENKRAVRWPIRWTAEEQQLILIASEKSGKSPTDIIRTAALDFSSNLI